MKKYLFVVLALVLALSIAGCADNNQKVSEEPVNEEVSESPEVTSDDNDEEKASEPSSEAVYHKISSVEAKEMMDNGALVLDVRQPEEYEDKHIDGAVLSPLGNIAEDITNHVDSKDEVILIYCRSGNRSKTATNILVDLGYTNVYDFGGIIDWPYGTVK